MSPKDCAYIVERLAIRFMDLVADHERQLSEHRTRRMDAESERDGLMTQVQDMRAEIKRLQWENKTMHKDTEDGYAAAIKVLGYPVALEPDLTQLHAKGKEAWSDVPNATQWVEEMRGNSEATHDTEAGKAAAESALKTEPVKIGNVVKVCSASGDNTARSDIGKIGEVIEIDSQDGTVLLSGGAGWVSRCDVRKVTT